jgi:hypothetical protein
VLKKDQFPFPDTNNAISSSHCCKIVLKSLLKLPASKNLDLKTLGKKLAILLALTSPKRVSEISRLDRRFMATALLVEAIRHECALKAITSKPVSDIIDVIQLAIVWDEIPLFFIYQAYQKLKKAVLVELLSIASLGQKRYVLWLASQNMK